MEVPEEEGSRCKESPIEMRDDVPIGRGRVIIIEARAEEVRIPYKIRNLELSPQVVHILFKLLFDYVLSLALCVICYIPAYLGDPGKRKRMVYEMVWGIVLNVRYLWNTKEYAREFQKFSSLEEKVVSGNIISEKRANEAVLAFTGVALSLMTGFGIYTVGLSSLKNLPSKEQLDTIWTFVRELALSVAASAAILGAVCLLARFYRKYVCVDNSCVCTSLPALLALVLLGLRKACPSYQNLFRMVSTVQVIAALESMRKVLVRAVLYQESLCKRRRSLAFLGMCLAAPALEKALSIFSQ
jgi:hypothetical protein